MTATQPRLRTFLGASPAVALVEVAAAKGSTPREQGAWMLVSPKAIFGTIGGGQLEFMAIDRAREILATVDSLKEFSQSGGDHSNDRPPHRLASLGTSPPIEGGEVPPIAMPRTTPPPNDVGEKWPEVPVRGKPTARAAPLNAATYTLSIPLGPEIGQCCGGHVELSISPVNDAMRAKLIAAAKAEDAARPHVNVFGGGHVGHALAAALALLPVNAVIVETRADALGGMPDGVTTRLLPMPEKAVRDAPPGSAFLILTHDHALDFLILAEALKREDAAYVGMIGSKTKKATFRSWYLKTAGGTEADFARLVSPIGGAVRDKRPAVIAALAAAEVMTALAEHTNPERAPATP